MPWRWISRRLYESAVRSVDPAQETDPRGRLVDLAYDAIFRFELADNRITSWNRGAEEMYGWPESEAVGARPYELLRTVHDRPRAEIVAEVIEAGRWSGTIIQTTKSGRQLVVDARWTVDTDAEGRPTGILEVNRDITELRNTLAQLEFANQVAAQLNSSLEPEQVLDRLLTIAVAAAQATQATVARKEGDEMVVEASYDAGGTTLSPGTRWRGVDVEKLPDAIRRHVPKLTYRLTVPLAMGGEVVGMLTLGRSSVPFTPEQRGAVDRIAAPAALALHNSWLFKESITQRERARRNEQRTRLALDVATDLAREPDLNQLIAKLLSRELTICEADRGSIARVEGAEMVIERCIDLLGDPVPAPGQRFPLTGPARSAVQSRAPEQATAQEIRDLIQSAGLAPGPHPIQRALVLPLVVNEEVVGVLGVVKRRPDAFTDDQVASLHQVTGVAALLVRTARLLEDARRAEAAKTEFINVAGHELRTPLTVLKGYLSLLLEGALGPAPEAWDRALGIMRDKLAELEHLIESVIRAARVDTIQLLPSALVLDLNAQAMGAVERAQPRAELEGAELKTQAAHEPVHAVADPEHLARILDSLLNNSLDYSERPARVVLEVSADGEDAMVLVRDHGIGLAPEAHEAIFERFVRLAPAVLPVRSGSGLGLYLCRRLARAMGGDVFLVESAPGKGTVMAVRLPRALPGVRPS